MPTETREPTRRYASVLLKLLFWTLVAAALATLVGLWLGWN